MLAVPAISTVMHSFGGPQSPQLGNIRRSRDLDFLWDCIRLAAAKASAEIIRYILEMGRGCGIQTFNNAIDSGSTEVVPMFIDKDPSLIAYVGSHNKVCLDVALNSYVPREKTVPVVRLLLANGANPLKPTPLMWKAVSPSYPEAVEGLEGHETQPPKVDFLHTVIYTGLSTIRRFIMTQYF